jgi:acyl-CoA thioesterase
LNTDDSAGDASGAPAFDAAALREFFRRDRFAAHSGVELLDIAPGYARAALDLADRHFNAADVAHGGALFTLADFAAAVASNSRGGRALAIHVSMQYLRPATAGRLIAEAREISCGPRLATYAVEVRCDEELVATLQAMAYRRPQQAT